MNLGRGAVTGCLQLISDVWREVRETAAAGLIDSLRYRRPDDVNG